MGIVELVLIAIGLSMDAFAVSICKGLATKKVNIKQMATAGIWFGGFQALMPLIGFLLGTTFASAINKFDHWIAFILLVLIGGNMLKEALGKEEADCDCGGSFAIKTMFVMAIATSIDALAVGVTFAFLDVKVWIAVIFIGVITFIMSAIGIKIGNIFGDKYKSKAELLGGIILILLGVKILVEALWF